MSQNHKTPIHQGHPKSYGAPASQQMKAVSYGAPASQQVTAKSYGAPASQRVNACDDSFKFVTESGTHYLNKDERIEQWIHNLSHWEQEGRIQFVTFRLADSLPQVKLAELREELNKFESQHPKPWDDKTRNEFLKSKNKKIEYWLEQGYGECVLKRSNVRQILTNAINHVDGHKCLILGYVIMPNHVHMLMLTLPGYKNSKVLGGIRQYSSNQINKLLNRSGEFWQDDPFDRVIRGEAHLKYCLKYIENNPKYLSPQDYMLYFDYRLINSVLNREAIIPPLGSGGSIEK